MDDTTNNLEHFKKFVTKMYPPRKGRDPARIAETLSLLRSYWEKYPDLRLGQIIGNFTDNGKDPYNLEDTDLIAKLKAELKK